MSMPKGIPLSNGHREAIAEGVSITRARQKKSWEYCLELTRALEEDRREEANSIIEVIRLFVLKELLK